jgi:hypothetical protein
MTSIEYKGYRIEVSPIGKGWRASIFSPGSAVHHLAPHGRARAGNPEQPYNFRLFAGARDAVRVLRPAVFFLILSRGVELRGSDDRHPLAKTAVHSRSLLLAWRIETAEIGGADRRHPLGPAAGLRGMLVSCRRPLGAQCLHQPKDGCAALAAILDQLALVPA